MTLDGWPSNPTVVSWGGRRLEMFARGADDSLLRWFTYGSEAFTGEAFGRLTWFGPENLGGQLVGDPVAVARSADRLDVFARGSGNVLCHWWWDTVAERFRGPETRSGWRVAHDPVAASWGNDRVDIFARSVFGGQIRHWWSIGNDWYGPENIDRALGSDLAVLSRTPGVIDIFGIDPEGALRYWWLTGGDDGTGSQLSGGDSLGGTVAFAPAAVSYAGNRLDVFARTAGGQILHWGCNAPFEPQRWFQAEPNIPGASASDVRAVSLGVNDLNLFAADADGGLQQWRWDAAARRWDELDPSFGPLRLLSAPTVVYGGSGLEIFGFIDRDYGVQQWHFEPNWGWFGAAILDPYPYPPVEELQTAWSGPARTEPALLLTRPADLVILGVWWSGFDLHEAAPGEPPVLTATTPDARVLLTFPPQHIGEEVEAEDQGEPLTPTIDPQQTFGYKTWQARLSGPSRVAFHLDQGQRLTLTTEGVLDALSRGQILPGSFLPDDNLTAIELPWGLTVAAEARSADAEVRSDHATRPVQSPSGAVGLWRSRVVGRPGRNLSDEAAHAVDTGLSLSAYAAGAMDTMRVPLPWRSRSLIVAQDNPARLDRLELSPLGGSLAVRGDWETFQWEHGATLGRDMLVRTVERGVLYPCGHRYEYTEQTVRVIDASAAEPIAVLRKTYVLTITEALRGPVTDDPALARAFPFTEIEITQRRFTLPNEPAVLATYDRPPNDLTSLRDKLAENESALNEVDTRLFLQSMGDPYQVEDMADEALADQMSGLRPGASEEAARYLDLVATIERRRDQIAVIERTGTQPITWYSVPETAPGVALRFPMRLSGRAGDLHLDLPMLMVTDVRLGQTEVWTAFDSLTDGGIAGRLRQAYTDAGYGVVDLPGVAIDLVGADRPSSADVQEVHRLNITGVAHGRGFVPRLGCPPEERLASATPAERATWWGFEVGLGAASGVVKADVRRAALCLTEAYERAGQSEDIAFEVIGPSIDLDFRSHPVRSGGLIAPNMAITGISRTTGLGNLDGLRTLDPAKLFDPDATLLGFPLAVLVANVTKAPTLVSVLAMGKPAEIRLEWTDVTLTDCPPFEASQAPPTTFKLSVVTTAVLTEGAAPTTETTCTITNFALAFPPVDPLLRLTFESVTFRQVAGKSPQLEVNGVSAAFLGDLQLLQLLQDNVGLGSAAPTVHVTGDEIVAQYSLPVPDVREGAFVMQNLAFHAAVTVPFDRRPVSVALGFASRERPFLLSVLMFGGGGYVDIEFDYSGLRRLEVSLEFGAAVSVSFVIASGEVHVLGGIRYQLLPDGSAQLTGYLRIGGSVEILGLVSVSVELVLSLGYQTTGNKLVGRATLVIEIDLTLYSDSVELDSGVWEIAGDDPEPARQAPVPVDDAVFAQQFAADDALLGKWIEHRRAYQ